VTERLRVVHHVVGCLLLLLASVISFDSLQGLSYLGHSAPLVYDEAFNLEQSYHLATAGHYHTHPSSTFPPIYFNPHITTGVPVLGSVSVNYLARGGPLEERGREVMILFSVLIPVLGALILFVSGGWTYAALLLFLFLHITLQSPWVLRSVSMRIMGEAPAYTFLLSGALSIAWGLTRTRRVAAFAFAGVLFALAVLSKLLMLLQVLCLCAALLWLRRISLGNLALTGFGMVTTFIVWEVTKISVLGTDTYLTRLVALPSLLRTINGGALPDVSILSPEWYTLTTSKLQMLAKHLVGLPVISVPVIGSLLLLRRRGSPSYVMPALIFAGLAHIGWFVLLAPSMNYRHLVFGLLSCYMGLVAHGLSQVCAHMREALSVRSGLKALLAVQLPLALYIVTATTPQGDFESQLRTSRVLRGYADLSTLILVEQTRDHPLPSTLFGEFPFRPRTVSPNECIPEIPKGEMTLIVDQRVSPELAPIECDGEVKELLYVRVTRCKEGTGRAAAHCRGSPEAAG
jgi:hypothetical protein